MARDVRTDIVETLSPLSILEKECFRYSRVQAADLEHRAKYGLFLKNLPVENIAPRAGSGI